MPSRATYIRDRLLKAVLVILSIVIISFFLIRLPAGDPVDVMAGEMGSVDLDYVEGLRQQFGLDRPLFEQLLVYMRGIFTLDLGYSYRQQTPVLDLVLARLPATLVLAGIVLAFSVVVGTLLGALAARNNGRWPDNLVSGLGLLGYATPNFWLGIMLVLVFAVWLRILPPFGISTPGAGLSGLPALLDQARYLVLPVLTLGTHYMAVFARISRASMIEVADLDYVKAARAKGVRESDVFRRHILRNSLLPVVTYTGLQAGNLVGGAVLTETVFAWPGIGRLAYEAIAGRDYMLLLGTFIVISVLVIAVNLITDLVYTLVDPRIELA